MGHQGAPVNSTFVTNVSVSIKEVRAVEGYLRFQKATIADAGCLCSLFLGSSYIHGAKITLAANARQVRTVS
jgi:hypothetical protein